MAVVHVDGRYIVESAGPVWHFIGIPSHASRCSLTLTRPRDALSPLIKSSVGKLLTSVQITDPSGRSATLLNARITQPIATAPRGKNHWASGPEALHSNEIEEFDLVFQKITFTNTLKSKSATDDWSAQT
jgi:type VI protein secretion system component Hcp